jgi:tRNA 5-methylaminomethyl-2-thiouridine biosynthesis bifunctional protein
MVRGDFHSVRAECPAQLGVSKYERNTPSTAIVIGAGIAGCAAAQALACRGISVTLIERSAQLASAASGNPRGILHARFGAGDNPLHRFVLASYGHALGWLDDLLPVDDVLRAECGLLQLACNPVEAKRISRLAEQSWPEHLMIFVDAGQASQLSGVEMKYGGLWFPAGGWVVPPKLCAALADDERINQRLAHEVEGLEKSEAGWQVSGSDAQGAAWTAVADVVLVCCAHSAKKLAQFAHFPLIPVRGQISLVAQTEASHALQSVVCGEGYCAPAVEGIHVMGATHAFDDVSTEVRGTDHAENLAILAKFAPALNQALGEQALDNLQGRASIRCSAPGSMPLVGEVELGLYCSLAHGTRGLLTAGIAGEVLAAKIFGQLPPLPTSILDALAPLPRVRHKG